MSQTVIFGDTVYLAGQVPNDYSAGIKQQTEETLAKVDKLLEVRRVHTHRASERLKVWCVAGSWHRQVQNSPSSSVGQRYGVLCGYERGNPEMSASH